MQLLIMHPIPVLGFDLRQNIRFIIHGDLMSCDVKLLVVRLMFLIMYWLHTKVIRQDRSCGNMINKIIFILFVNLRMDSPADIFLASKERLDYLDKKLVYQT